MLTVNLLGRTKLTIGCSPRCDVLLKSPDVSRHHALLLEEGDRWLMIDISAAKGMFLKGESVRTHWVNDKDPVRIGEGYFWFFGKSQGAGRELPTMPDSRQPRAVLREEYVDHLWQIGRLAPSES